MGQTLARGAGLTARQKQFLAVVLQEPYLLKRYYLSGGTALSYPNNDMLKVDFSYYPSERIEAGTPWKGLTIDSLYDIAVNKFQTIMGSPRGKDYVDFYCVLQKKHWSVDQIRRDAGVKFGIHQDSLHLVRQFLLSVEFQDLPKMFIPFDRAKMDQFYSRAAKQFKSEILTS